MKYTCHYCGEKVARITKDHIVPTSRGGQDKPWNVVQSCFPCNSAKANEWPTCGCLKCQRAIKRHGDEEWPAYKLRAIPLGKMVFLNHPKGSLLVGRKVHSDIDDIVAVPGLGDFALHKMKRKGWNISLGGFPDAPRAQAVQAPPDQK